MFRGISWTVIASIVAATLQIVVLAVSARVLDSSELGLIALGGTVLALTAVFIEFGFGPYIIYKGSVSRPALNSLLLINMVLSLFFCFVISISSLSIENFFEADGLSELLIIYSIILLTTPFLSQFQSLYISEKKLANLAYIDVLTRVCSNLLTVVMLYSDVGVNSIVYGLIITSTSKSILLYKFLPEKYKITTLTLAWKEIFDAWSYCSNQLGSQILNFFRAYIDNIIIGRFLDMETLGIYSLARDLIAKIPSILGPIYSKVFLPVLSQCVRTKTQVTLAFKSTTVFILSINTIIFSLVALNAELIVNLLYGPNKTEIIDIMVLLSIFYLLRGCGTVNGLFIQSTGKTNRDLYWNIIATLIFPAVLFISVQYGMNYMIYAMLVTQLIFVAISYFIFHFPNYPMKPGIYLLHVLFFVVTSLSFITFSKFYDLSIIFSMINSIVLTCVTVLITYITMGKKEGFKTLYKVYK